MGAKFSSVRGTVDFDTYQSKRFYELIQKARTTLSLFGYEEIMLPLLEETGLFVKGVGATSDIVERQMFMIEGKDIVLRPEGTAQVIRYYIQQALHKQTDFSKFFYIGPMFRGERPQKGRLRQFHHIGAEAIGSDSIYLDAEMILLALEICEQLGAGEKELKINTLGCAKDKEALSIHLKEMLAPHQKGLCENCNKRLSRNPLRVLDCKTKQCQRIVMSLELSNTHICSECIDAFKNLLSILADVGVQYTCTPYMVRGLDYYTNTVFEIISSQLGSQDAIGAGGRYNKLVQFLGGPDIPAIGFALGLERILLLTSHTAAPAGIVVFIAVTDDALIKPAFGVLHAVRKAGIKSDCGYGGKSLKGQLRLAQKRGVRFVVIIGDEEWRKNHIVLKDMREQTQQTIPYGSLIASLQSKIALDC